MALLQLKASDHSAQLWDMGTYQTFILVLTMK